MLSRFSQFSRSFTSSSPKLINPFINDRNFKINKYSSVDIFIDRWEISEFNELNSILLNKNDSEVQKVISQALTTFENFKYKSVTIKVPASIAKLISFLVKEGFSLHHTDKSENIVLTKWLDTTRPNKIPEYPYTQIGIGSVVITKDYQFVMVKERIKAYGAKPHQWKFVTGIVDFPESIFDASLRELNEEIGVASEEVENLGNLYIRWMGPLNNCLDCCFFNLFLIKENIPLDRMQKSIDKDELSEVKYFSLEEVKEYVKTDNLTVTTKLILDKLLPLIDLNKNFESNLVTLKNNALHAVDEHAGKELRGFMYAITSMKPKF